MTYLFFFFFPFLFFFDPCCCFLRSSLDSLSFFMMNSLLDSSSFRRSSLEALRKAEAALFCLCFSELERVGEGDGPSLLVSSYKRKTEKSMQTKLLAELERYSIPVLLPSKTMSMLTSKNLLSKMVC